MRFRHHYELDAVREALVGYVVFYLELDPVVSGFQAGQRSLEICERLRRAGFERLVQELAQFFPVFVEDVVTG